MKDVRKDGQENSREERCKDSREDEDCVRKPYRQLEKTVARVDVKTVVKRHDGTKKGRLTRKSRRAVSASTTCLPQISREESRSICLY